MRFDSVMQRIESSMITIYDDVFQYCKLDLRDGGSAMSDGGAVG